jgi:hypothetical protein
MKETSMKTQLVVMLLAASAALAADVVSVKPTEISETRVKQIVKGNSWDKSGLEITLHVEGATVDAATAFGKMKFTTAVDDAGGDLKPKEEKGFFSGPSEDKFNKIDRFMQEKGAKGFDVRLKLALPKRSAKTIKEIKGEMQVLAGGDEKVVEVKNLATQAGKSIDDPALKAAGLQIKFTKAQADASKTDLPVEVKGDPNNIKEVEILDASGQKINQGYSSGSFGGAEQISYMLSKPLDDTMTMKIHVLVGQKTMPVPFDLTNLELP